MEAISNNGLKLPAFSRSTSNELATVAGRAAEAYSQHALAGVLADADEFERSSAAGGKALVAVNGERGGEWDALDAGLQGADDEVMAMGAAFLDG